MKKFICTVCGYVYEGEEAPEFCPQCKVPRSKFKELVETEGALTFADEHVIGVAKGVDAEVLEGLKAHFTGECTEVGMYLAMSRQADREGYPEVAEAFKRYAWEEAEHAAKFCELLGECVWDTETNLKKRMEAEELRDEIAAGFNKLYEASVVATLFAYNLEELDRYTKLLAGEMSKTLVG